MCGYISDDALQYGSVVCVCACVCVYGCERKERKRGAEYMGGISKCSYLISLLPSCLQAKLLQPAFILGVGIECGNREA